MGSEMCIRDRHRPITNEAPSHKNCFPLRFVKSKKSPFTGLKSAAYMFNIPIKHNNKYRLIISQSTFCNMLPLFFNLTGKKLF